MVSYLWWPALFYVLIYSGTPLLRHPLLREFHYYYYANIQKARIFSFFIFVFKKLATTPISYYANSLQRQFSPITNLFFLLKLTPLQRQFVFGRERRRKK